MMKAQTSQLFIILSSEMSEIYPLVDFPKFVNLMLTLVGYLFVC